MAWNNKGVVLEKQGKYDDAILAFDEAIRLDPKNAKAWIDKGNCSLIGQDKYADAIEAYDETIRLDPKLAYPWYEKGRILEALGRTAEATAAFIKANELGYVG